MIISPLLPNLGVEVRGVRATTRHNFVRQLTALIVEHGVVVVRRQSLSLAEFLALAKALGTPITHAVSHRRSEGHPEISTLGNTEEKDVAEQVRNGAVYWHSDKAYEASPASFTMLWAELVPRRGGETLFANLYAAYDSLPEPLARIVRHRRAAHLYGAPDGSFGGMHPRPTLAEARLAGANPAIHPLVIEHPVSHRRSLYAVAGTPFAVVDVPDEVSWQLLTRLRRHALQAQFTGAHRYLPGDLVVWDNLCTLHSATPIGLPGCQADRRRIYRISVRGYPESISAA